MTSISIGNKTTIKGKGFIEAFIEVNEVGFKKPPSVTNKKIKQKGALANGQTASEACAAGCEFKITNGDGKCTKVSVQPTIP